MSCLGTRSRTIRLLSLIICESFTLSCVHVLISPCSQVFLPTICKSSAVCVVQLYSILDEEKSWSSKILCCSQYFPFSAV